MRLKVVVCIDISEEETTLKKLGQWFNEPWWWSVQLHHLRTYIPWHHLSACVAFVFL